MFARMGRTEQTNKRQHRTRANWIRMSAGPDTPFANRTWSDAWSAGKRKAWSEKVSGRPECEAAGPNIWEA